MTDPVLARFLGIAEDEEILLGKKEDLRLFLVEEGEVSPAGCDAEWDGERSVLVLATSEEEALKVASAYDAGVIDAGNTTFDGKTIAVVMFWGCYE